MALSSWVYYRYVVLFLLLLTHILNQLGRYLLAITIRPMAQELHFGEMSCQPNGSGQGDVGDVTTCSAKNWTSCHELHNNSKLCVWDYNGQGLQYQILAGPVFTVVFTVTGVIFGFIGDGINRKIFLCVCLVFWSGATILNGVIKTYWQLVVLRFGLGIGEAGCTPFATSLIADYFPQARRGLALGIYNLGIYLGYSFSFALGNFITSANILGQGWRWSYIISGCPGVVLSLVILLVVKEPKYQKVDLIPDSPKKPQPNNGYEETRFYESTSIRGNVFRRLVKPQPRKNSYSTFEGTDVTANQTSSINSAEEIAKRKKKSAEENLGCEEETKTKQREKAKIESGNDDREPEGIDNSAYETDSNGGKDALEHNASDIDREKDTVAGNNRVSLNDKSRILSPRSGESASGAAHRWVKVKVVGGKLWFLLRQFINPSLALLVFAGSVRNSAGFVWAYNTQQFFVATGQTPTQVGAYMSWVPMVGGSIGVVLGGLLSDRFVKRSGSEARIVVVVLSQLLSVPFAVTTLLVSPPYAYFCQIPAYIMGEMWVGVTLTVVIELVPASVRTGAVAVYLFVSTNIAGAVPLAVPALRRTFRGLGVSAGEAFKDTLYVLYPGLTALGAVIFLVTVLALRRDRGRIRSFSSTEIEVRADRYPALN